jgi:hypothetical protein
MRRGIGNPWRNKLPNPAIYAEALGKKFQAWRTQFSLEQGMDTIAQLPSIKEAEISKWLKEAIAGAADDPAKRAALETMLMQREFNKMEGAIDGTFYKRFLTWLMGKGQEEDHIRTPWYRQAQALELEEVRELLEAFLWEIHLVENQLLKLVWKGPQTLNEYYLYFKYVLQHQEFVLETDPWFFLEWRQYSKDNVVMDPHGKPVARAGLDQANLGHERRPPGASDAIEAMLDFFAQLQSITKTEVDTIRKEADERQKRRLQDKAIANIRAEFTDDDSADGVAHAERETEILRIQTQTLNELRGLPEKLAAILKPAVRAPTPRGSPGPSRSPSPDASASRTPSPPPSLRRPPGPAGRAPPSPRPKLQNPAQPREPAGTFGNVKVKDIKNAERMQEIRTNITAMLANDSMERAKTGQSPRTEEETKKAIEALEEMTTKEFEAAYAAMVSATK